MTVKRKIPSEAWEQKEVIRWWSEKAAGLQLYEDSLFHIPNGTQAASRMKKRGLGVRSGVPDLFLALPSGGYHGLWIELKRIKGGTLSPEQVDYLTFLKSMHYAAFCCKGAEAAKRLITQYLLEPDSLSSLTGLLVYDLKGMPV